MRHLQLMAVLFALGVAAACSEPVEMKGEAEARRDRSHAVLIRSGISFNEHLPLIETTEEVMPRTSEEVALRAMALAIVAVKGETPDHERTQLLVERFKISSALTPDERTFVNNPTPSEQDRIRFSWRYESLGVMLWALGFRESLGPPDKLVDVPQAIGILSDLGRDGFLEKAKLRPMDQILDEADLIYRYHWAVTDARINGKSMPGGVDPGVVYERHYALNWLIRYQDQEWDDISTDT